MQASNARHRQRELPRSIFAFFFYLHLKKLKFKTEIICSKLIQYVGTHMSDPPSSFRLGLIAILRFLLHVSYTKKRGEGIPPSFLCHSQMTLEKKKKSL